MKRVIVRTTLLCLIYSLPFNFLFSQNLLLQGIPKDSTKIEFRYLHPNLSQNIDITTLSGIYDLSLNVPVSPTLNVHVSFPYMTIDLDEEYFDKESGIGNIYLGVNAKHTVTEEQNTFLSFGVFLPTAPDNKLNMFLVSAYTDFTNFYKYTPNTITIVAGAANHRKNPNGFIYGFELSPVFMIPTEDNDDDSELYIKYGFKGGIQGTSLAFISELAGIAILTEDVDDFSDRFVHEISFGAQWIESMIKPAVFYEIYLKEDLKDVVDGVLVIKVDVELANF